MAIRLVTDSSSDLPKEIIQQYKIEIVPLTVIFGNEEYRDGVDITPSEFYKKLAETEEIPSTSQVQPDRFIKCFKPIIEKGDQVLCITIGSSASGTCQSAFIAKDELESDQITIIDSNSLCMGTGYLVIVAAKMIEEGKDLKDIITRLQALSDNRIEHLFCVDTMTYLRKGGRVKASQAIVAELLNIKPILKVEDAITQPISKVRGRKKIIPYYLQYIENTMDFEKNEFFSIVHSVDAPFAKEFEAAFIQKFKWEKPIYISELGATIGTHSGPGVLAAFFIKK